MAVWASARQQVLAIQFEGRMIEHERARVAFDELLNRHAALTEEVRAARQGYEQVCAQMATTHAQHADAISDERERARKVHASTAARVEAAAEAGRQSRMELFMRQVVRRMHTRDLDVGFGAWVELWRAKTRAMQTLREVGNHLLNRDLADTFYSWSAGCLEAARAAELAAREQHAAELQQQIGAREQAAEQLQGELAAQAENTRAREEQLLSKSDQRVEELRAELAAAQVAFRERETELLAGQNGAEADLRARLEQREAKEAELLAAHEAELAELRQAAAGQAEASAAKEAELIAAHEVELVVLRVVEAVQAEASAAKEAELEKEAELLRTQLEEMAEEYAEREEEQAVKAHDDRIELITREVVRKFQNSELNFGFTAWIELWQARTNAMQKLREVGNRMRSPELADTFYWWSDQCTEEGRKAEIEAQERRADRLKQALELRDREIHRLKVMLKVNEPSAGAFMRKKQEKMAKRVEAKQRAALVTK